MLYDGRLWVTVGRWARDRGMSRQGVRENLLIDGLPIGEVIERDPRSQIQIRRIRGFDVLVKRVNCKNWLYLPQSIEADVARQGGHRDARL